MVVKLVCGIALIENHSRSQPIMITRPDTKIFGDSPPLHDLRTLAVYERARFSQVGKLDATQSHSSLEKHVIDPSRVVCACCYFAQRHVGHAVAVTIWPWRGSGSGLEAEFPPVDKVCK